MSNLVFVGRDVREVISFEVSKLYSFVLRELSLALGIREEGVILRREQGRSDSIALRVYGVCM